MLTFVGLGLWDERSVTVAGRDAIRAADRCFAEFYTSRLMGTSVADLERFHETEIEVRDRAGVEQTPAPILEAAEAGDTVFLTAGDPMISTTHVDLRLRAHERDVDTRIVHAPTAQAAASSLTGLQNYRFGKATTLPFPRSHGGEGVPDSVLATIEGNLERDLHTLVYLDIAAGAETSADDTGVSDEAFMSGSTAAGLLANGWRPEPLAVVVARAGSPEPVVVADRLEKHAERDFGGPLHLLIVPAELHHMEAEALGRLAGAPDSLLPD